MPPKRPDPLQLIAVKLPPATVKLIDRWSKKSGRANRSEAIRALIDAGLKAEEQRAASAPQPAWVKRLEEAAARAPNTDINAIVDLLVRDIDGQLASAGHEIIDPRLPTEPTDQPDAPAGKAKPKKGPTLGFIFGLA